MAQTTRFSIIHMMIGMAIIAVFCAALFNESRWWRATLGTVTSGMILNSLLAAIFSVGERRAFSLSYFVGALFFVMGIYTYVASLPYLITISLMEWIGDYAGPRRENFLVVSSLFWLQVTCIGSAFIGRLWYRRNQRELLAGLGSTQTAASVESVVDVNSPSR
jgi:hypothetical protein